MNCIQLDRMGRQPGVPLYDLTAGAQDASDTLEAPDALEGTHGKSYAVPADTEPDAPHAAAVGAVATVATELTRLHTERRQLRAALAAFVDQHAYSHVGPKCPLCTTARRLLEGE